MGLLRKKSWSPYLAGALIGMLSWFSFASANKPIGITTAFEYSAALLTRGAAPGVAATNPYYAAPEKSPKIDWEWMLVLGVFVGAYLSSKLSGDRGAETVPELWRRSFGGSKAKRLAGAFLGGSVMMFGARLAQGCTSGHGISGAMQLAVSSWTFVGALLVGAVGTAFLLYGKKGVDHV